MIKSLLCYNENGITSQSQNILSEGILCINNRDKNFSVIERAERNDCGEKAGTCSKQAALEAVTMKLADVETLVDEVVEQAYDKACEVVTYTVRQETQKEVDAYKSEHHETKLAEKDGQSL